LGALVIGLAFPGTAAYAAGKPGPATAKAPVAVTVPAPKFAVREVLNIRYYRGPHADPVLNRLDLYLPKGKKDFPVIVFVHGGVWMLGDKSFFGWGSDIGHFFAGQGIGAVMVSYRLAPQVQYQSQMEDVARAVAWTYRHIGRYGGCPKQFFLVGHSAGGHLVSLLATDPQYLKAQGLSPSVLKGVVSVSGVYRIPEVSLDLGQPGRGLSPSLSLPGLSILAGLNLTDSRPSQGTGGWDLHFSPFSMAFGSNPKVLREASPINHVKAGLPPFLIVYADRDLPTLADMAHDFAKALKQAKDQVETLVVPHRNHETVMFDARTAEDPVAQAILKFVKTNQGKGCRK
jgi:acetyl esterase/lipase